jgi:hypothetical protein
LYMGGSSTSISVWEPTPSSISESYWPIEFYPMILD